MLIFYCFFHGAITDKDESLDMRSETAQNFLIKEHGRPYLPFRIQLASSVMFWIVLLLTTSYLLYISRLPVSCWPRSSDDMYYYFLLVRHYIHSGMVSVDGIHPTNGFHPIYFLLLRCLFPFISEDKLPNLVLVILTCFHCFTCILLYITIRNISGRFVAGIIATTYASNPYVLGIIMCCVETSITCFAVALCLWIYESWLRTNSKYARAFLLLTAAFAVLSRTDTLFFIFALALAPMLVNGIKGFRSQKLIDYTFFSTGAIPLLLFMLWSYKTTGDFVQSSGRSLSYWQTVGYYSELRALFTNIYGGG